MSNIVHGRNVIVEMLISSVYYPVFCAKTAEFSIEQDEIETTHINSGPNRAFVPGMANAMLNVAGVTTLNNTNGRVSILYLMQQSIRREIHTMRVVLTDQDANAIQVTFSAFIRNTSFTKDVISFSQSNLSMRVTGVIDFSELIGPPEAPECEVQDPLYIDVVEGAVFVHSDLLEQDGVVILAVSREGVGHEEVFGTPDGLQFRPDLPNGDIYFDPDIPFNSGEVIYILYKILP